MILKPTDEEQLRHARRNSLRVLLARIERGLPMTQAEAQQLRRYVEAEIRDADTSRAVARGNLRHVQILTPLLEQAEARAEAMTRAMESTAADALVHRGCHRDLMAQCLRAEQAEDAVKRVRALHQPMQRGPFTICMRCSGWDGEWRCLGVVTDYPCDTLAALDETQEQRP